jgi:hypothetical protein
VPMKSGQCEQYPHAMILMNIVDWRCSGSRG